MNADLTTDDTGDEDFTWVSGDHGPRLSAWTCAAADCNGGLACSRRDMTHWHGSPEDVALHHAAGNGSDRVHVYESGRVRTFKTWWAAGKLLAREVL
jgi:hypothetical protein